MNALDFDDLMIKTLIVLTESIKVRQKWQGRYDHILVDEFQDTNDIQFSLLNKLLAKTTSLYVLVIPIKQFIPGVAQTTKLCSVLIKSFLSKL